MAKNLKQEDLDGFTGTSRYYQFSALFPNIVLTDGTIYVAENGGAYWLMDAIASHQTNPKVRREEFQVWKLRKIFSDLTEAQKRWNEEMDRIGTPEKKTNAQPFTWRLTCEDGNNHVVTFQDIEYSDFPLDFIDLWVEPSDEYLVIYLPSEH